MSEVRRAYDLLRAYVTREWDRIRGVEDEDNEARRELEDSSPQTSSTAEPRPENPQAFARSILGVGENASFAEIRRAFDRLSRRSDPSNFPPGSPEGKQAAEILRRVNWAYRTLSESVDAVEKRFSSLEIDIEEPPKK